jgi:glycopeptide antibiotics resistance protein
MVFAFYVLVMIKLVILPIHMPGKSYNAADWQQVSFLQIIPFATIIQMLSNGNWFIQILGNIGVCLPVSFFLYYYSGKLKLMTHLIFGIFLSVMFELCQFIINVITNYPNRVVDIDDVLLNVLGVMLGYIIIIMIKRLYTLKLISNK